MKTTIKLGLFLTAFLGSHAVQANSVEIHCPAVSALSKEGEYFVGKTTGGAEISLKASEAFETTKVNRHIHTTDRYGSIICSYDLDNNSSVFLYGPLGSLKDCKEHGETASGIETNYITCEN